MERIIPQQQWIDIVIDRKPFEEFGTSTNQKAVGGGLDLVVPFAVASGTEMEQFLISLDFYCSSKQITRALEEVNPEMYTVFPTSTRIIADYFSKRLKARVARLHELSGHGLNRQSDGSERMASNQGEHLGLNHMKETGRSGAAVLVEKQISQLIP